MANIPGKPNKYSFEYLKECVIHAIEIKDLPPGRLTSTAARCISIVEAERKKRERRADWEAKIAADQAADN